MDNVVELNRAFHDFTEASKSLESYYEKLRERVQYLTLELEKKNVQLKDAVEEMRESKDYLQTVLQSMGDAMIVLDQDEKITMVNNAAERLLHLASRDVRGLMFEDLHIAIQETPAGTRLTAGGMTYDVILSRSAVSEDGGSVRGYVLLIRDISPLKELERQNERNQRLIAMGEMAATIVHEIRSPLCSIELFSNMLSGDLRDTAHADIANGISTGIKSLNNILTNMLFFAKPQRPSFTAVNPAEPLGQSLDMLMPLIRIRGIRLSKSLTGAPVAGDPELMKQVFMNVILNAVQAMPDGGDLGISIALSNGSVDICVSDSGEGIDPEIIEKIFDPFFSTKERGTGLGLAIAHKIMQGHGGFIRARRNEVRGSTFVISFPPAGGSTDGREYESKYEKAGT